MKLVYQGERVLRDLYRGLTRQSHFILKTDDMNLTYLNVIVTGKVQRWKRYLQDKDFLLPVPCSWKGGSSIRP